MVYKCGISSIVLFVNAIITICLYSIFPQVFGEMGVVGLDKDLRTALQNQATGMEKWAGSAESVNLLSVNRPGLGGLRPKTQGGIGSQDLMNIPGTPLNQDGSSQASLQVPQNLGEGVANQQLHRSVVTLLITWVRGCIVTHGGI